MSSFGTGACPCRCPSGNFLSSPKPKHWDKKKKKKTASVSPLPAQLALGRILPASAHPMQSGHCEELQVLRLQLGVKGEPGLAKGQLRTPKKSQVLPCSLGQAEGPACGWVTRDSPRSVPAGRGGAGQDAEGGGWGRSATRCPRGRTCRGRGTRLAGWQSCGVKRFSSKPSSWPGQRGEATSEPQALGQQSQCRHLPVRKRPSSGAGTPPCFSLCPVPLVLSQHSCKETGCVLWTPSRRYLHTSVGSLGIGTAPTCCQHPSNAPRIPLGLPEHRGRSERAAQELSASVPTPKHARGRRYRYRDFFYYPIGKKIK